MLLLSAGQLSAIAQVKKIIIDCDPGVDDATALVLGMNYPGFEIMGITTAFLEMRISIKQRKTL